MFCSGCGKQLKEDDRFCSGCGKTVERENIIVQENNIQDNNKVIEKIEELSQTEEKSPLRKEYFKWLIIITIIFGLLEVLLVFLMPFGEIHAKVLGTLCLIVLFGLIGLLLIGFYENTNENKFPFAGIGINVACFALSALLVWEILSGDFIAKFMWCLVILLIGLIIISALFTVFSNSKYMDYSRKVTNGAILSTVVLLSLGIYNNDLFDVDIFVRAIWAICILVVLGLFVTLLLSKIYGVTNNNQKVKKKNRIWPIVILVVVFGPSLISNGYFLINRQIEESKPVSIPYAKVSIPANTFITEDMIGSINVHRKDIDNNYDLVTSSYRVVGMYTKSAINKGDYFYYTELLYDYELLD